MDFDEFDPEVDGEENITLSFAGPEESEDMVQPGELNRPAVRIQRANPPVPPLQSAPMSPSNGMDTSLLCPPVELYKARRQRPPVKLSGIEASDEDSPSVLGACHSLPNFHARSKAQVDVSLPPASLCE